MSLENKIGNNFFSKIARKAAPYLAAVALGIGLLTFGTSCQVPTPDPEPHPKKNYQNDNEQVIPEEDKEIVLFAMDDFQIWWLEDIQDKIVQKHMDNDIPLTLGVIPLGISGFDTGGCEDQAAGERFRTRIQNWNGDPTTEVAQHGYDHVDYLEGMSYDNQYNILKKGKDLMNGIGVYPKSFIPPYGLADLNTVCVVRDLGFHTLYNPCQMNPTNDETLVIIQDQIFLCENEGVGPDAVFKDYSTLKSEINQKIDEYGVALVLDHMQDFNAGTEDNPVFDTAKADQIIAYAKQLKADGYTLMTVEDYNYYLHHVKHYPK